MAICSNFCWPPIGQSIVWHTYIFGPIFLWPTGVHHSVCWAVNDARDCVERVHYRGFSLAGHRVNSMVCDRWFQIGPVNDYIKMLCENAGLKLIVFAHYHVMMDSLTDLLHDLGVKFIRIDGHTPQQDRPVSDTHAHHVDTHHVDTHVDTHYVDTHHVDTHHVDTHYVDTHYVDTHHVDTHHVDTHHVDTHHRRNQPLTSTNIISPHTFTDTMSFLLVISQPGKIPYSTKLFFCQVCCNLTLCGMLLT